MLREDGGSNTKPVSTASAVYDQLHRVIAEVPEHLELASRIADETSKHAKGIAVLAGRACLIRLISETISGSAGGR